MTTVQLLGGNLVWRSFISRVYHKFQCVRPIETKTSILLRAGASGILCWLMRRQRNSVEGKAALAILLGQGAPVLQPNIITRASIGAILSQCRAQSKQSAESLRDQGQLSIIPCLRDRGRVAPLGNLEGFRVLFSSDVCIFLRLWARAFHISGLREFFAIGGSRLPAAKNVSISNRPLFTGAWRTGHYLTSG